MKSKQTISDDFWRSTLADCNPAVFPAFQSATLHPVADSWERHSVDMCTTEPTYMQSIVLRLAWAIVMAKYNESDDVVFGTTSTECYAEAGLLPVRVRLPRNKTIKAVLESLESHATAMKPFEQTSLQNIRRLGSIESAACDFRSLLLISSSQGMSAPNSSMDIFCCSNTVPALSRCPLTVFCDLGNNIVEIRARFSRKLLQEKQVRRILHQFAHVLKQVQSESDKQIQDVSAMSPEDLLELSEWNAQVPDRVDSCVHVLIQKQYILQPEAPAICSWDGNLTYSELEDVSSRFAVHLASLGVGPEIFVPLYFEKSKWMIVAILAVIKSGGAYVPLNPFDPLERSKGICGDVRAKFVVCSRQNFIKCHNLAQKAVILDEDESTWQRAEGDWTPSIVRPDNAVYVVFTSGSTGKPKGAIIEHAAFCSSAMAHGKAMFLESGARVFQFASHVFDTSNRDILTTLLFGGCICVPSELDRKNDIAGSLSRYGANFANLTSSVAQLLSPEIVPSLRRLVVAGEPMLSTIVSTWAPNVHLINAYGPSECAAVCSVQSSIGPESDPCNIGHAVGVVRWIVESDNHDKLAPISTVGELLLEGPTLGRGYLNDVEKTAAAFIKSPSWLRRFRDKNQGRLYKTGDLVRYNSDGTINYVGRKDTQVKLHGQRIELREVEHHVRRCLVEVNRYATDVVAELVTPAGHEGRPKLVAFIKATTVYETAQTNSCIGGGDNAGSTGDIFYRPKQSFKHLVETIKRPLSEALPIYMIPSIFIPLRRVPLTTSGKTNRMKLRESASAQSIEELTAYTVVDGGKQAPSTRMELAMQALWADILHIPVETLGREDSFFRRGGDSIDAMRLVGVARHNGLSLTVADIFAHPKLCDLAMTVEEATNDETTDDDGDIPAQFELLECVGAKEDMFDAAERQTGVSRKYIEDIYPCTPLQEGLMALTTKQPGTYMAQSVLELSASVDVARMQAAWTATLAVNPILRTRIIQYDSAELFQVVISSDVKWATGDNLEAFLVSDRKRSMALGEPLNRFAIIEEKALRRKLLVWTSHHSTYDGWSRPLILEQLKHAYLQDLVVQPPVPFSLFIRYLSKMNGTAMEDFWSANLAGSRATKFPRLPSAEYLPRANESMKLLINLTGSTTSALTDAGQMTKPATATAPLKDQVLSNEMMEAALQGRSIVMASPEQIDLPKIYTLGSDRVKACNLQALEAFQPAPDAGSSSNSPSPQNEMKKSRTGLGVHLNSRLIESDYTMSTLIKLAWAIVLGRYTGSDDVVFGLTVSGRNAPVPGIESITGPTFSTVPLRIHLRYDQKLKEALQIVQEQLTAMIPFEQMGLQNIRKLGPEAASACDFQNMLVIQPTSKAQGPTFLKDVEENFSSRRETFSNYPLMIECKIEPRNAGVTIIANFDGNVLMPEQVQNMMQQFGHVLQQMCVDLERRIRDVEIITPEDLAAIGRWNAVMPKQTKACIHELVHKQCKKRIASNAVHSWDGELTYEELDQLSTQLAGHLTSLKIGPELFVPLYFEKSKWAIVAMLGVMKAGGACVPLDPSHPAIRTETIIKAVNAKAVISAPQFAERFTEKVDYVVTNLQAILGRCSPTMGPLSSEVRPGNAAFMMFTSGSTGVPKGILLEHAALCTSLRAQVEAMQITAESRYLQFAAYTFDVSVGDIFATLIGGGCVCVPSEHARLNDLAAAISSLRVNQACLTPTVASQLRPSEVPTLKTLTLGGEPLTSANVETWAETVQLNNVYGPAECSIWCVFNGRLSKQSNPATIGRGMGAVCWVVDDTDHNKLAPLGTVGELLIEGPALARNYLNDTEKTQAAFIEDPPWLCQFRGQLRGRLYKTGDLVRYHPDGTLNYVGRKDTQIKLHGQRIELGEVEHHVGRSLGSAAKVVAEVIVPASERSTPQLAVFVQLKHEPSITGEHEGGSEGSIDNAVIMASNDRLPSLIRGLETTLSDSLPTYMIPSVFIPLMYVPLTTSGKIDRRRLREAAALLSLEELMAYTVMPGEKLMPTTKKEQLLQQLWSKTLCLGPENIGMEDSFFGLGGDSIKAMKLVGAARAEGWSLTVANIFGRPRLSDLVHLMVENMEIKERDVKVAKPFTLLGVSNINDFLSNITSHHVSLPICDIIDVLPVTNFQRVFLQRGCDYIFFDLSRQVNLDRFIESCNHIISQHDILRTIFVPYQDSYLQIVLKWINYEVVEHISDPTKDIVAFSDTLCRVDAEVKIPPGRSLLKLIIVKRAEEQVRVILRISHAQYDGVCLAELWSDLGAAYNDELIHVRGQFPNYMHVLAAQRNLESYSYWKSLLEGSSMTQLKATALVDADRSMEIGAVEAVKSVGRLSTPMDISTATLIKAAWAYVLAKYSARLDIVFGQLTSGRHEILPGLWSVIGPCINTIPIRVLFQQNWKIMDLCHHMQEQYIAGIPFETLEFQDIVKYSTNWPTETTFGSIIQHQNIDRHACLSLGNFSCTPIFYEAGSNKQFSKSDAVWILSFPHGIDGLRIKLQAPSSILDQKTAAEILGDLCDTIVRFSESPYAVLPPFEVRYQNQ